MEGMKDQKILMGQPQSISIAKWASPPAGLLKLNTDVSIAKHGSIGMGFIVRDNHSSILVAEKSTRRAMGCSTLLEGLALHKALEILQHHQLKDIIVESDSKLLIDGINGMVDPEIYCDVVIADIQALASTFSFMRGHQGLDFFSMGYVPTHALSTILDDV
ncbi:hypothetical protein C2S51_010747 [Perilla frutescens var. frutescens]|nr:hypothetical protein C2S51_010747 [Perilla frutescens var. frutescens]